MFLCFKTYIVSFASFVFFVWLLSSDQEMLPTRSVIGAHAQGSIVYDSTNMPCSFALSWKLHGMGGDSSAAYNPAYDACASGFAHSTCDGTLRVDRLLHVPLRLHMRFTLGVPLMLIVTQFIYVSCMLRVPHMLHMPLILHVPHMLLVPRILCVPRMLRVHLFLTIRHFKSDLSLLLVLVVSYFPYTQYCAFMRLRTNTSNCFQIVAFTGKK